MDFIERIFGVSPDGGNGSMEFMYLTGMVAAVALIAYALHRSLAHAKKPASDESVTRM